MSLSSPWTYAQDLLLNEWYGFDQPGDYRLEIGLGGPIRGDSGAAVEDSPPQEIDLSISLRNPELLARRCQELTDKAISPDAESALAAAKALSYVADLIAVPYLGKLTRSGPFVVVVRGIAIDGLNRIATAEGAQTVVSHLAAEDLGLAPQINGRTSTPTDCYIVSSKYIHYCVRAVSASNFASSGKFVGNWRFKTAVD